MLRLPELSDLQVFHTVAQTGSVTAAAKRLHRVQSSVSSRLKVLEEQLGVELFVRQGKGMQLSPAGERLLGHAEDLLSRAAQAVQVARSDEPCGPLRVGSMESTAAVRLPPLLAQLHRAHPALEIHLATGPSHPLSEQVLAQSLDAAFVAEPPEHPELQRQALWQERLVLVGTASAPNTLLAFRQGCAYRGVLQRWCQQQALSPRVIELNSYHAILSCASAGMGLGIVPESVLASYPWRAALHEQALPAEQAQVPTYLVWHAARQHAGVSALLALAESSVGAKSAE